MPVRRRITAAAAVLGVVSFSLWLALDDEGLRRRHALGKDLDQLETRNAQLRGEIELLRRRADALRGDPKALERAARENGYVRDDEILFQLR